MMEFQDFWKLLVFRIHEPLIPGKGRQGSLIIWKALLYKGIMYKRNTRDFLIRLLRNIWS
ncbi:hypothetical protein AM232_10070 [Bacillus sp. FJAT-21352]|nr:hypothetical protein AM232_10070 [Bacillus sp. FJAT-21352]